jgi:uncharacterized membrane protein YczE
LEWLGTGRYECDGEAVAVTVAVALAVAVAVTVAVAVGSGDGFVAATVKETLSTAEVPSVKIAVEVAV